MKTADLVDTNDADVEFCDLAFLSFGRRRAFFGLAQTVKCFEDNVLLRAELETPGEGRVLVVDGGGSTRLAIMGDIVAGLAQTNGWAGVVLNAAIRDSAEINQKDVGVLCLGTSPKKSGKSGAGETGVPVKFGGVTIRPGDWVYADADGVLVSEKKLV